MMLLTPGPVDVHPDVLAAAGQPPMQHRSPEFLDLSDRVWDRLAAAFQTTGTVSLLAGSGMTGIEAAIASLHQRGSRVLVFSHGRFGERFTTIAQSYGLTVISHAVPWGETITPQRAKAVLADHSDVDGVWLVHAETSSGVALDLESIARAARSAAPQAMIGADVVTSLGVQPVAVDEWGLDVAVTGLQKGLACIPGMAAVALSERAQARAEEAQPPTYTMNLHTVLQAQRTGLFPFTPPVTIVAALDAALERLHHEGLQTRWEMHAERHRRILDHCRDRGLSLFGDGTAMGVVVVSHDRSTEIQLRLRQDHGIHVAGGQDHLAGTILRFGTMGYRTDDDLPRFFTALDTTLKECT